MMKKMFILLSFLVSAVLASVMVEAVEPLLPGDVQMVNPDPSLPQELKDCWGKWEGGKFIEPGSGAGIYNKVVVIIERIDDNKGNLRILWKGDWIKKEFIVVKNSTNDVFELEFEGGLSKPRHAGNKNTLYLNKKKGIMVLDIHLGPLGFYELKRM
jgi:hypothetical protein